MNVKSVVLAVALVLSCALPSFAQKKDWAQFGRYEKANQEVTVKPLAVLMGDSITDGWDNAHPEFFADNNLICRGISGQTSSEMLVRFRRDVIDLAPKYVVILAGTNDIACNNGVIAPENTVGNIISMCELAKLHRIRPILCSVTPSVSFGWRKEITGVSDKIIEMNRMLNAYAKANRIPYVDYHSAIRDEVNGLPKDYSSDGVHPNRSCYDVMESILLKTIR